MRINNIVYTKNTSTISYGQNRDLPQAALKYLNRRKRYLKKHHPGSFKNFDKYNLERLEGIQNGIKIFEGLSLKKIVFLVKHLTEIILKRGCHNMCSHCYAKAMPPSHIETPGQITQVAFEDFKNFCDGAKILNNRMGFNIFKNSKTKYNTLFHDADSSMITLIDKNGKNYDYADLAKMLHDATNKIILFDTSGWNIQDTKTQARMEALVKKVMETDIYNFMKFNISINPFHSIYGLALKYERAGNIKKAKKYRDIYTNRLANVIYTLAPLRRKYNEKSKGPCLDFIMRTLPDLEEYSGQDKNALTELLITVYEKLKQLHKTNISTSTKPNVTNEDIDWIGEQFDSTKFGTISAAGRAENLIHDNNDNFIGLKTPENLHKKARTASKIFEDGFLNLDGTFYITNWTRTYRTDINLNYANKGKPTAPIHPNLSNIIITEDIM